MRVHPKSLLKLKAKLKMLTGRGNGMGYERRKAALHQVIRGWVSYFKYADPDFGNDSPYLFTPMYEASFKGTKR